MTRPELADLLDDAVRALARLAAAVRAGEPGLDGEGAP